jgi:ribose transport system permease protein
MTAGSTMNKTPTKRTELQPDRAAISLTLQRYSTLLVLIVVFVAFSIGVDSFFTQRNLVNILLQISILSVVGIGTTICVATREIDLSIGYVVGLAGLIAPLLLTHGYSTPVAIIGAIGAGLVVGAVNAFVVTVVRVPSLITTLATGSIVFGVNFLITRGRAIYGGMPDEFLFLGQASLFGLPVPTLVMALLLIAAFVLMQRTLLGRYLYAVGGNARAAELAGVAPNKYRAIGLALSAFFAAIAGIMLASRLGSGQPNAGERYLLDSLATVFIGMTMFKPGTATIAGTFFGALLIGVINNGLNLLGLDSFVQYIFKGVIIIIAVSIISRRTSLKLL